MENINEDNSKKSKSNIDEQKGNINQIQEAVSNDLTNPFLIASLTNSVMMKITNKGPFFPPNKSANSQISGPYDSYKTSIRSKAKIELKRRHNETFYNDDDDIEFNSDKDSEKVKNKIQIKKKKSIKKRQNEEDKNEIKENEDDQIKELNQCIYSFKDNKGQNILYSYQKISSDGTFYYLRCKDRNCSGTAKFNIDSEEIILTKKCSIEYSKHNYIIESKIKEKIDKNEATEEDMEEYKFQKMYFMQTYYQYPSLTYNQILLNMVEKYKIKKIKFNNKNFNVCKSIYQKKIYNNVTIDTKLDNIKLQGKKLLNCKLEYIDLNDKEVEKNFRIYGTKSSMSLLISNEITQYFTDCTYKCLPYEIKVMLLY